MKTMGVMLRFGGVSASKASFERKLSGLVQWSCKSGDGLRYAQIDIVPEGEYLEWDSVELFLEMFGDRTAELIKSGAVATAELDIGLSFYEEDFMASITVPSSICHLAGRFGIAITVTYFATSDGEEEMD